jgi:hypothetical protein
VEDAPDLSGRPVDRVLGAVAVEAHGVRAAAQADPSPYWGLLVQRQDVVGADDRSSADLVAASDIGRRRPTCQ